MAGYKKLNSLKPITEADIQKEKEQHPSNDKEFTDNTNLDAYIDMVEQTGTKEIMEKDVEIENLKNKLMMSENKVRELESEIEKLKSKLNSNDITTLNNKIKEMDKENDNILLSACCVILLSLHNYLLPLTPCRQMIQSLQCEKP